MSVDKEHVAFITRMRELMKLRHGREFVWQVLSFCDLYVVNASRGRRAVGIDLLSLLDEIDPTLYARIILEQQRGQNDGQLNQRSESDSDDTGSDTDA